MIRTLPLLVVVMLLASCAKPLYNWDTYNQDSYNHLKKSDDKSQDKLLKTYEKMIAKPKGTRGVPPPGVYADYGFFLISLDRMEKGEAMLEKEIELYPESKVFIDLVLNMMRGGNEE
jgi:hypothetical protein